MTLATMLVLHEWTDPIELHTWFNANVLKVADKNPTIRQTKTSIGNALGQGFDAIFEVDWREDRSAIVWFDRASEEENMRRHVPSIYTAEEAAEELFSMESYYGAYPDGVIKIDWDTAYGYRGPGGMTCTDLHAMFIVRLAKEYLEPRGIGFTWQNEYTSEWNVGLTGFDDFGSSGAQAQSWFINTAAPAIAASIANGE